MTKKAPTNRVGKAAIGRGFPARTRGAGIGKVKPAASPSRPAGSRGAKGTVPGRSAKYELGRRKGL